MHSRGNSSSNTCRKKLSVKKIENSTARQVTYSKRKDGMIKKANELAVLCDIDIAFIMFSPSGRLTCFSSNRSFSSGLCRVEDVFLRFLDRPDDLKIGSIANKELIVRNMRKLKYEAEMLEKIAEIESLEEKLGELSKRRYEAKMKMSHFRPNMEKIHSSLEANAYLRFLDAALKRIQMSKGKLLGKAVELEELGDSEGTIINSEVSGLSVVGESSTASQYSVPQQPRGMGIPSQELSVEDYLPVGSNVNSDYQRMAQNQWYMPGSHRFSYPGNK
ncbi:hypothetical protein M9H77_20037 [Catharanthus roseus]|uniref:Uncharacterized protein n=1 Tax=Catharanthus roseus TaxID=4058 RepID=A0ACC0AIS0_CATRO|nr:hypothetical protein M9H77_20037 [Catharanthus roseus]